MPKRKPKLISKAVEKETANKRMEVVIPPSSCDSFVIPPKTHIDEIYDIIENASALVFADEDGRPWIEKSAIEDRGDGIYIVKFRCPIIALYNTAMLNLVVERVCSILHSDIRYFCGEREVSYCGNIRQRYYECVWVICEGELLKRDEEVDWEDNNCESCIDTQEEIDGELTDESTAEEVEFRIDESLENFV